MAVRHHWPGPQAVEERHEAGSDRIASGYRGGGKGRQAHRRRLDLERRSRRQYGKAEEKSGQYP